MENEVEISLRESPMKCMLGEISDSKPCFPITIHIKTKCAGKDYVRDLAIVTSTSHLKAESVP